MLFQLRYLEDISLNTLFSHINHLTMTSGLLLNILRQNKISQRRSNKLWNSIHVFKHKHQIGKEFKGVISFASERKCIQALLEPKISWSNCQKSSNWFFKTFQPTRFSIISTIWTWHLSCYGGVIRKLPKRAKSFRKVQYLKLTFDNYLRTYPWRNIGAPENILTSLNFNSIPRLTKGQNFWDMTFYF